MSVKLRSILYLLQLARKNKCKLLLIGTQWSFLRIENEQADCVKQCLPVYNITGRDCCWVHSRWRVLVQVWWSGFFNEEALERGRYSLCLPFLRFVGFCPVVGKCCCGFIQDVMIGPLEQNKRELQNLHCTCMFWCMARLVGVPVFVGGLSWWPVLFSCWLALNSNRHPQYVLMSAKTLHYWINLATVWCQFPVVFGTVSFVISLTNFSRFELVLVISHSLAVSVAELLYLGKCIKNERFLCIYIHMMTRNC